MKKEELLERIRDLEKDLQRERTAYGELRSAMKHFVEKLWIESPTASEAGCQLRDILKEKDRVRTKNDRRHTKGE